MVALRAGVGRAAEEKEVLEVAMEAVAREAAARLCCTPSAQQHSGSVVFPAAEVSDILLFQDKREKRDQLWVVPCDVHKWCRCRPVGCCSPKAHNSRGEIGMCRGCRSPPSQN